MQLKSLLQAMLTAKLCKGLDPAARLLLLALAQPASHVQNTCSPAVSGHDQDDGIPPTPDPVFQRYVRH